MSSIFLGNHNSQFLNFVLTFLTLGHSCEDDGARFIGKFNSQLSMILVSVFALRAIVDILGTELNIVDRHVERATLKNLAEA